MKYLNTGQPTPSVLPKYCINIQLYENNVYNPRPRKSRTFDLLEPGLRYGED